MNLDSLPAGRRQHYYRQSAPGKVLLTADVLICCNDYIEFDFGRRQQLAIVDLTPPHFVGGGDRMAGQCTTKRAGAWSNVLHEGCSRHKTLVGVAQHKLNLFSRHPGEPLQELVDPGASSRFSNRALTGTRLCLNSHSSAALAGHALDRRAFAPVQHDWDFKCTSILSQAKRFPGGRGGFITKAR